MPCRFINGCADKPDSIGERTYIPACAVPVTEAQFDNVCSKIDNVECPCTNNEPIKRPPWEWRSIKEGIR